MCIRDSQGGVFLAAGEDEIEDAFRLGAQADGDPLVAEQVLEQARVAIDRHPLEGVLEMCIRDRSSRVSRSWA